MTLAAPAPGLGSTLAYHDTTDHVFLQLTKWDLSSEVGTAESTNLSSTAKEYIPTLPDFGSATFEGNYKGSDASLGVLYGLLTTPVVTVFVGTMADATKYTFSGILTKFALANEIEEVAKYSGEIKVTGAVVKS